MGEQKEDWCDDFRACYNLDWADEKENSNFSDETSNEVLQGDLLFVVAQACSKLNILSEAGESRCEELCEDRECCWFDRADKKNCWDKTGYCDGYSLCESACTTRKCCFVDGPSNCANEFPIWCKEVELCDENLDMKTIMSTYTDKTEANIVEKACSNVGLLPEGHPEIVDCRQVCSERACCFFPGRDNCSNKNREWCDEFSPCLKLNLFAVDDDNPSVQNFP